MKKKEVRQVTAVIPFEEVRRHEHVLFLSASAKADPAHREMAIDLHANRVYPAVSLGGREGVAMKAWGSCNASTPHDTTCSCDLTALKPLQNRVGRGEVAKKMMDVRSDRWNEVFEQDEDPIKVVRGPGGALYVVDHHHGALSFLRAGEVRASCSIRPLDWRPERGAAAFWSEVRARGYAWLKDEAGQPVDPDTLPATLAQLPDDPYRTLAWMLRKDGSICRKQMESTDFAEFWWADWLRRQPTLPRAGVADKTRETLWTELGARERDDAQRPLMVAARQAMRTYTGGEPRMPNGYNDGSIGKKDCND